MRLKPNQELLHYRLVDKLGEGGMGVVWKAVDTVLDREVAIKILPDALARDADRLARFKGEAKLLARLNHPNIVTLHSVEKDRGLQFLTMELVRGKPLESLIPADGMTLAQLLDVALPLTSAVASAHGEGITHRDLKPANVMVGDDRRIKVLDFGLARENREGDSPTEQNVTMTAEGRVLGTAAYMSPEQAEGRPLDQRTDIFSMGIILHEIATGERPFRGDSHASVVSSILRDEPPSIAERKPNLPRHFGRIVRRCLAKDRERRYSNALELHNELLELKREVDSGELATLMTAPVRRGGSTLWLALAGLVVVASVVWLGLRLRGDAGGATVSPAMRIEQLTSDGDSWDAAISPDGQYVARVVRRGRAGGRSAILLRQLSTGSETEILAPVEPLIDDLFFSPDGGYVFYTMYSTAVDELFRLPALGGMPGRIASAKDLAGASCSPDGSTIALARGLEDGETDELVLLALDGKEETVLASRRLPETVRSPAWSPDGKTIAFTSTTGDRGNRIVTVDVKDRSERIFAEADKAIVAGNLAWLPDGNGLLSLVEDSSGIRSRQIRLLPFPRGTPRQITNDASFYDHATVSRDGRSLVATRHEWSFSIWVVAVAGPQPQRLLLPERLIAPVSFVQVDWLEEGRVVFNVHDERGSGLSVVEVADGKLEALDVPNRRYGWPRVLPGTAKVLVHDDRRDAGLWVQDLESGERSHIASGVSAASTTPSSDGKGVYFLQQSGSGKFVRFRSLDGEESRQVWGEPVDSFLISEDADRLLLLRYDTASAAWRIEIASLADGSVEVGEFPEKAGPPFALAPGSNRLAYVSTESGAPDVWIRDLPHGEARQLSRFDGGDISGLAWSRDGERLIVVVWKDREEVMLIRDGL